MTQEHLPAKSSNEQPVDQLPAIAKERLPWHPHIGSSFEITRTEWRVLVESIFPNAQQPGSIIMALGYCKSRGLDIMKRPVHVVPVWDAKQGKMVEHIWPGIGELRTTAFRTGNCAGRDETTFGPDITETVGSVPITYPEWAQVTYYRLVQGLRVAFCGPRVYWKESYAERGGKDRDKSPNAMWTKRPRGQLEKCADAAALRATFPEEIGNQICAEEVNPYATMERPVITFQESKERPGLSVEQPEGIREETTFEQLTDRIRDLDSPDNVDDIRFDIETRRAAGDLTDAETDELCDAVNARVESMTA